jgi:hypothetical protein
LDSITLKLEAVNRYLKDEEWLAQD